MTTINPNTPLTSTPLAGTSQNNSVSDTASQASIPVANTGNASHVSISPQARELVETATNEPGGKGYQIMLDRLFGGKFTQPLDGATGYNLENLGRLSQEYLTYEDRTLLADMYDYAQSQGADLKYVDEIAITLGRYRQANNGKIISSYNSGHHYDLEGHLRTISFAGEMAEVADRIKNGSAINSTRFDRGFLNFQLDPGYGALASTFDPAFLEHMVNHFSGSGSQEPMDSRFAVHVPLEMNAHYVIHTSDEILHPHVEEPDVMKIDGKWFITEQGRAKGITMEQVLGIGSSRDRTAENRMAEINEESIRYLLDMIPEKDDGTRPAWLKELLEILETKGDSGPWMFTSKEINDMNRLLSASTVA